MDQQLPPPQLVITWLDIIQNKNNLIDIVDKRTQLLCYDFGAIEFADMYIEQTQCHHQKAF